MAELRLSDLGVRRGGRAILDRIDLTFRAGAFVALVGANGAGKTTLLRAAAGLLAPDEGSALLDGTDLRRLDVRARARRVAYLPQARPLAWPICVGDLVRLGRFAFGEEDEPAVAEALAACGLADLVERAATTLSGGELARAHVARALAPRTPALIADEPVAGLDPGHAWRILEALKARARAGALVIVSLHEPSLAGRFADRIVALADGRIAADGAPEQVLGPAFMAATYGVETGPSQFGLEVRGLTGSAGA
jgi:iron complex transport system ATP-binding protein